MSCCGDKRESLTNHFAFNVTGGDAGYTPPKMWPDVWFEYTGDTGLTVYGNITAKKYRFNAKGDKQLVDYRDADGMRVVPVLKKCAP